MSSCTTVEDSPINRGTTDLYQTIHRVVGLPELLSIIFSSLEAADLARAARVCQLWSSVALDRLWECIPDIDRLINVYSRLKRGEDALLHFEDVFNGGRWDKFWSHACRVRTVLRCRQEYGPGVIPHLLRQVKNSDSGQTFLPKIRDICFRTWLWDVQSLSIFSLIPSGLESLSIDCSEAIALSTMLKLNQALEESPVERLKVVELSYLPPTSEALRRACTNVLHQQKFLERIHLSSLALTTEDLQNIGELPHLTELRIHHQGRSVRELREAFATIGKLFLNLQRISLEEDMRMPTDMMVMEGLAPCHELREVSLRCALPQAVTAEAIRTLARYWPKLEELYFDPVDAPSTLPGAPLAILEDIALAWSETLSTLSLVFDTSQELPRATTIRGRLKREVTLFLNYTALHKDRVMPVAEFIAALCTDPPSIDFHSSRPGNYSSEDCWETVQQLVSKVFA
ncbi:hypothetical protein FRC04_010110 [Tulasnella sp. 424]|nr:hypothetical protein FRC04_010110 [Tulasnella sp. 424]KAG8974132.1 hypothetical protein FRC05_007880 [Tulasnella sp. 425]